MGFVVVWALFSSSDLKKCDVMERNVDVESGDKKLSSVKLFTFLRLFLEKYTCFSQLFFGGL